MLPRHYIATTLIGGLFIELCVCLKSFIALGRECYTELHKLDIPTSATAMQAHLSYKSVPILPKE